MSSLAGDVSLLGSNIRTQGLARIHAKQGDVTLESVVDNIYQNTTQTTQNFYKNTGSIDGSYQEMLNKTGISADGIDIQSKTTNLNAVDLKATNGAIIVGNAHLVTDEDGKLKLDGNGKPIIVSGDTQNLSLGTVDLTNETWYEHSKSYRGFAKDLMKGVGVVAGALGI